MTLYQGAGRPRPQSRQSASLGRARRRAFPDRDRREIPACAFPCHSVGWVEPTNPPRRIGEPRHRAARSGRDHAEGHRDTEFIACGARSDLGHGRHSWLRGPHHHRNFAQQSAARRAWRADLGELDVHNGRNAACARRASRGDRALGVRARYIWRGRRYQRGHLFIGWQLHDFGFRHRIAATLEADGTI